MRLPQSISQHSSVRIISLITLIFLAAVLPGYAGASTRQLTCIPATVRFGAVPVGQTETQVVVLTNTGTTSVTVTASSLTGSEFSLSSLTLPLTLSAGQSISSNLTFSPTATGWITGSNTFTSSASNSQLQLQFGGTGTKSAGVTASPSSLSFGQVTVGSSSTLPVVLTNTRSWTVTLTALQLSGAGFSVSGAAFPVTLSAGQSIMLNLTFTPLSASTSSGSAFVTGPSFNVPLNGTGTVITAGQLTITPSSVNFGNVPVGTTDTQPITMSAIGSSVTVSSDASSSAQFVLNGASLPFTIAAGQSLSFNVAFTPQSSGTVSDRSHSQAMLRHRRPSNL